VAWSIGSKEEKSEKYHFRETEFNSALDKIFLKKTGKDSRLWGNLKIFFADFYRLAARFFVG
jgi:hypothetical protein